MGKRLFDIVLSSFALLAVSPIILCFAFLIKADSRGPVFYRGERVGKGENVFRIYKFRTMVQNAEAIGASSTADDDPRITKFGKLLRRLKLDELPQIINIFKGEMSFVGPRPEMPFIVEKYNETQKKRLRVKPGLTGMWQVSSERGLQIHENMDYDLFYIEHQGFLLDLAIILRTFITVVKGRGAW